MRKMIILAVLFMSSFSQASDCLGRIQTVDVDGIMKDGELCADRVIPDGEYYIFINPHYKISGLLKSKELPISSYGSGDTVFCAIAGFQRVSYRESGGRFLNEVLRIDTDSITGSSTGGVKVHAAENQLILKKLVCTDTDNVE